MNKDILKEKITISISRSEMDADDKIQMLENAIAWTENTSGDNSSKLMLQSFLIYAMCKVESDEESN